MSRFLRWVSGWIDIGCGLVAVSTAGFYRPSWDMAFVVWAVRRHLKRVSK